VDKNSVLINTNATIDASVRDENNTALEKTDEALDEKFSQPAVVTTDIETAHSPTFVPEKDEWDCDATMDVNIRRPAVVTDEIDTMHFAPRFSPNEDEWACDCY
jgi:hypothetical protein